MSLFLLVFFLIYGGVHTYAFLRVKYALNFQAGAGLVLALFMILMVAMPVLVHVVEKRGFERTAIVTSHIGYLWMGLIFFFFVCSALFDFYRLLVYAAQWVSGKDFSLILPSARQLLAVPLVVGLCITVYGYFEARDIRLERIRIPSPKISAKVGVLRIVQISDVHVGLMVRERRLRGVIDQIVKARPDILVSTGDLLDGQVDRVEDLIGALKEIKPKYGKYAIMGNHEYFAGLDRARSLIEGAGFVLLKGDGERIAGIIDIIGFDDPAGRLTGTYKEISAEFLRRQFPGGSFRLCLKHRPTVADTPGLFDLQLSGHTHKGQIFPFSLVTRFIYPMNAGFFKLPANGYVYVSRGSGTWGPPIRFLSPPEVTLIELVHTP